MAEKNDELENENSEQNSNITDDEVLAHLSFGKEKDEEKKAPKKDEQTTEEEDSNDTLEPIKEKKSKDETDNNQNNENIPNDESINKEKEQVPVQMKQPKVYRILTIVAGVLFVVLIIGLALYFSGFFDEEPKKVVPVKKVEVKKPVPEVIFDEKEINKNELNKKLTMLTKGEIMSKEELEAEEKRIADEKKQKEEALQLELEKKKKEEELKLSNQLAEIQKEKQALIDQQEEIKKQQEEFLKLQEKAKMELQNIGSGKIVSMPQEAPTNTQMNTNAEQSLESSNNTNTANADMQMNTNPIEEIVNNPKIIKSFLSFINVAVIKGELYKSYLDDIEKFDKRISLCRDTTNKVEIYFGPYLSNEEREKVFNQLIENGYKQAFLVDFTEEEYKKRCEY